jgi:hypothetical protein
MGRAYRIGVKRVRDAFDRRHAVRGTRQGEPPRLALVASILGSYREMPGLSLRIEQAARLFGLQPRTCQVVLEDLVREGQLRRAADGQYLRG